MYRNVLICILYAFFQIYFNVLLLLALLFLFLLYCIDYAVRVGPFFPLSLPPPITSHHLRQSPHHCACPWVMCISSLAAPFPILYFTSPWLFCNYLYLILSLFTHSPIPPLLSGNHQNLLCMHDSVSELLVCLVFFRFIY